MQKQERVIVPTLRELTVPRAVMGTLHIMTPSSLAANFEVGTMIASFYR